MESGYDDLFTRANEPELPVHSTVVQNMMLERFESPQSRGLTGHESWINDGFPSPRMGAYCAIVDRIPLRHF